MSRRSVARTAVLQLIVWATLDAPLALAQGGLGDTIRGNITNVAKSSGLTTEGRGQRHILDLFGLYIFLTLNFAGVTFLVQVVHGGYLWMTAGGNEEQIKKAQAKITNGAIGVAVIFLAFVITYFLLFQFSGGAGVPFDPEPTTTQ